jgi:hypothetical protein
MTTPVFIDTSYILALLNKADDHHQVAVAASRVVQPPFITTEAVLIEIGNALCRARWRDIGLSTIRDLRSDPNIEVVPVDADLFARALDLYGLRMDKEWGLTDCVSFVLMQQVAVPQALTPDRHFAQAGFVDLLAGLPIS